MTARLPKYSISLLALTSVFFLLVFIDNYYPAGKIVAKTELCMGTIVEIKVPCEKKKDEPAFGAIIDEALSEVKRVEGLFSVYRDDSEVSKINSLKAGEELVLSEEVFALIEKSIEYSRLTSGAFDITVKPLVDLWKEAKKKNMPLAEDVARLLNSVGYDKVVLNREKRSIMFTVDGMGLDFGGIAKGYTSAMAMKILKDSGIKDAIVNPGGEMFCMGRKSAREMWRVGIKHPRAGGILFEIRLKDKAIATSGDYERFFVVDGRRYSHIIDPRSGYPVGDDVVSATVIADDPVVTDIIATALVISGEPGLKIAENMPGVDALLIIRSGKKLRTVTTKDFGEKYYVVAKDKL